MTLDDLKAELIIEQTKPIKERDFCKLIRLESEIQEKQKQLWKKGQM